MSALPSDADDLDLSRAARAAAPSALAVFIDAARSSPDERIRLEAARAIRDWAFGRVATQEAPPQPVPVIDDPLAIADFWAQFCNTEVVIWLLEVVREVRARRLLNTTRHYSLEFGIPLIEPPPPQRERARNAPAGADLPAQPEQIPLPLPDPD